MTLKRINDHNELTEEQINDIISNWQSGFIVENCLLITEGLSTTNYVVTVRNSKQKYLLKVYPIHRKNNVLEQKLMSDLSKEMNVPEIHLFDNSQTIIELDYLIMDFIEGETLSSHIKKNQSFDDALAYQIGCDLSKIQHIEFDHMGLIDADYKIVKTLNPISKLINFYLDKPVSRNLSQEGLRILKSIGGHPVLNELDQHFVLSHGDFNPNNIIVDLDRQLWYIDFEYCSSAPRYLDIGKFFRKRTHFSEYIKNSTLDQFVIGYEKHASVTLPSDWLKKAKLTDLTTLLGLINRPGANEEWVKYVEEVMVEFLTSEQKI